MSKVEVTGFDARGPEEDPTAFGFILFNDGMWIGYAPGMNGANEDGLFNCKQPYLLEREGAELRAAHFTAATKFVRESLKKSQEDGTIVQP